MDSCDVIVDLQHGDTGKGKVAHYKLNTGSYDLVLRYNGGSNAGHTIYHNGQKLVTHQIPAGVLYGLPSLIGLGCVVNLDLLAKEVETLRAAGIMDVEKNLFVDHRCHVVTSDHIHRDINNADRMGSSTIGSTGQGIGPAYSDKYARVGKRLSDYYGFRHQFPYGTVCDGFELMQGVHSCLAEGAQGFQLDIDWGDYPYVTSSHCTVGGVILNGVLATSIRHVIGVMKAYDTYVGDKMFSDMNRDEFIAIAQAGNEFGATTGRPRQVRWTDITSVKRAAQVNGCTEIIINKVDILQKLNLFGLIVAGQEVLFDTFEEYKVVVQSHLSGYDIIWSYSPETV
jgi:adenylosuccinate synthase